MKISARSLAVELHGDIEGDGDLLISDVAPISCAGATDVTFAEGPRSCAEAFASAAGVVLVRRSAPGSSKTLIRVENSREAFAQAMTIFHAPKQYASGIHASATLAPDVSLGQDVFIGPNVVLGAGVQVGDRTVVLANCVLADGVTLGDDCLLHPNITLYSNVKVGSRVILHSGTVVGSDGFGYARKPSGIAKIPQIGGVVIEDDVEIGSNVTIDRATMNLTIIGSGTKIDNQSQIAHNVVIGRNCLIAGQAGIGGSTRFGDGVTLGGRVAVSDHINIGANAMVGLGSVVTKDVRAGQVVWGVPARPAMEAKRESVSLRRLPALLRALRAQGLVKTNGPADAPPPPNGD